MHQLGVALASLLLTGCGQFTPLDTLVVTTSEGDVKASCGAVLRQPSGVAVQEDQGDAWATFHRTENAPLFGTFYGVVGDVTGDGCDDIAIGADDGIRIFFGPLGRGDWSADEYDVLFVPTSIERPTAAGVDVNGDGSDELWVGNAMYSYHAGVVTTVFETPASRGEVLDADADGHADALLSWSDSLVLAYGPLEVWDEPDLANGCFDGVTVPMTAACITHYDPLTGLPDEAGSHEGDVVSDVNEDGFPDIVLIDYGDWSEGRTGVSLFAGGDLRGSYLGAAPVAYLQDILAFNSRPVLGDVDLDGVDELAAFGGVLSASIVDTLDPNALAGQLTMTLPEADTASIIASYGDVDGDGAPELGTTIGGVPVLIAEPFMGVLPDDPYDVLYKPLEGAKGSGEAITFVVDPLSDPKSMGDVTGDGRADILVGEGGTVTVVASDDLFPL